MPPPPPLLPGEAKDSVLVNKLLDGEGYWECVKEILSCIINTKAGAVALPYCKLQEIWALLDIPISQRRMGRNDMERLVGNLPYMHLAVLGAVAHLCHVQRALAQAGTNRAWLSPAFHHEVVD